MTNYLKPGILLISNELFGINNKLEKTAILMSEAVSEEWQSALAKERLELLKQKSLLMKAMDV